MDDLAPVSMPARRKARLESFLKREIAVVVTQELRDPRIGFITVTRCELASDSSTVTAYYTLLEPKRAGLAQQALDRAAHYVQRSYAKHLRMRRLPLLRFAYDQADNERRGIEELIRQARASDPDPDQGEDTGSTEDGPSPDRE